MKKLCVVATVPEVVYSFMQGHIRAAADKWAVTVISSPDEAALLQGMGAQTRVLPFRRKISPWYDLFVFVHLLRIFRGERYELVHSIMPKSGLLAMAAAWLTGVPNRIHTFTGQVWVTKKGWLRSLLKLSDKLVVFFATRIIVDSPSQLDFLIREGVLSRNKGEVICNGSICGVDVQRFKPDLAVRQAVRKELIVSHQQTAILFVGRLNQEKGIPELAQAFVKLVEQDMNVVLLLVGTEEDCTFAEVREICGVHGDRLRRVAFTPHPERYMVAADIFCLPSHREGFGQVVIEAAACGVPVVASRIYGITDAVEDGKTGLLFPAGSVDMLAQNLRVLVLDESVRRQMGEAALARAQNLFSSRKITDGMLAIYSECLEQY